MYNFTAENIFSANSRESCIRNLKTVRIPILKAKVPKATAAVLIPLCVVNGTVSLIYTIRSTQLRSHSGQTSFPGGKTDEGETPADTALREAEEEIGIPQNKIDIWGTGPAVPGRDFNIMITPVIGSLDIQLKDLKLNTKEVQDVFTITLRDLCDPKNHYHTQFKNGIVLPVFLHGQQRIWGITAYITHIFLSCLLPKDIYKNDWMSKRVTPINVDKR